MSHTNAYKMERIPNYDPDYDIGVVTEEIKDAFISKPEFDIRICNYSTPP
jgi:hypothetical protein